jgi:hypothetical protein
MGEVPGGKGKGEEWSGKEGPFLAFELDGKTQQRSRELLILLGAYA